MEQETVRALLIDNIDETYKQFHEKLKAEGTSHFYGVRVPKLREIAKNILKNDPFEFLDTINFGSYEEKVLYGMVVSKIQCNFKEKLKRLRLFIEEIDSWAVCDVVDFKISKKEREEMWLFLQEYFISDQEFYLRFAIINTMKNFLDEDYIDRVLKIYEMVDSSYYYVNMGVAWALQVAFIKHKKKTYALFDKGTLSKEIINKAVQKIRDSRRVNAEDKEKVLKYKRKKS